jgi:hypothetical protein
LSPAGAAFRIELSVDQVREAQQKNPEARCYARPDRFVAALLAMTMSYKRRTISPSQLLPDCGSGMLKIVALCIAILVVAGCLPQLPYPMSQAMQPCPRGSYCLNEFSLSPDGRWVAFAAQGGICLFDWRSRNFRKIPNPEGGYAPSFSPDGRHIVAVVRTKRIAIIDLARRK